MISGESFSETGSPAIAMQWFYDFCKPIHAPGPCWAPLGLRLGQTPCRWLRKLQFYQESCHGLTDQAWRRYCVTIRLQAGVQQ